jgi:hypothetical protein
MSDPDGEILFVDYNTPTTTDLPEAIHDTLTDKTKRVMRVLRVSPSITRSRARRTSWRSKPNRERGAAALNPRNRWIPLHQHRHAAGAARRKDR